jgi:hypothetical protein
MFNLGRKTRLGITYQSVLFDLTIQWNFPGPHFYFYFSLERAKHPRPDIVYKQNPVIFKKMTADAKR